MLIIKTVRAIKNSFSTIKFAFILRDGSRRQVVGSKGEHLLQIAKKYDLDLEGACEASLACSTCHVYLPQNIYNRLEPAKDEQQDLLDLAFSLSSTSRLGCQVFITQIFEGTEITIPKASRNLYVDGTKPKSH